MKEVTTETMKEAMTALLAQIIGMLGIENSREIPIDKIKPFKNSPFKVVDDTQMEKLVKSISEEGFFEPVIVRPCGKGYEMLAGHRRLHAAKKAGLNTIPALVRELTDAEAVIVVVDTNIQKRKWLHSERAFACKIRMDAISRQGARRDLTCGHDDHKLKGKKARDIVAEDFKMSARSVQRYVRLTNLCKELWDLVDNGKLSIVLGEILAGFSSDVQEVVFEYIKKNEAISKTQLEKLRDSSANERDEIIKVLKSSQNDTKAHNHIKLNKDKLNKYFHSDCTDVERERIIWRLLDQWSKSNSQN